MKVTSAINDENSWIHGVGGGIDDGYLDLQPAGIKGKGMGVIDNGFSGG